MLCDCGVKAYIFDAHSQLSIAKGAYISPLGLCRSCVVALNTMEAHGVDSSMIDHASHAMRVGSEPLCGEPALPSAYDFQPRLTGLMLRIWQSTFSSVCRIVSLLRF